MTSSGLRATTAESAGLKPLREPPGRVVFVTGGSRGIGYACALAFHALGDRVAIGARSVVTDERLLSVTCDVCSTEQVSDAFDQVEAQLGMVEILVANAGSATVGPALKTSDLAFAQQLDVNLIGAFRAIRRALPGMLRRRSGQVVIVSSAAALLGVTGAAAYASAKAGLLGLTRSLARELSGHGIRVNAVMPGPIKTDILQNRPEWITAAKRAVPLGRFGKPEEVSAVIVFLASDAASYVTGALVPVDGGVSMGVVG